MLAESKHVMLVNVAFIIRTKVTTTISDSADSIWRNQTNDIILVPTFEIINMVRQSPATTFRVWVWVSVGLKYFIYPLRVWAGGGVFGR